MLNVHASLLPKYRGAAPVHRAIINGEAETGVTIMQMVEALDAGDMLAKAVRPIGPDETSEERRTRARQDGARLLLDVLDRLEAGTARAEPQDDSASTYAPRLTKEEGLIDWTQSARQIHNRVRGLYPWPHAYSYSGWRALDRVEDGPCPWRSGLRPDTTSEVRLKPDSTKPAHRHGASSVIDATPSRSRPATDGSRSPNSRPRDAGR